MARIIATTILLLLVTSAARSMAETPEDRALRLLNHHRELAGLSPAKLDQKLSAGCMEHAKYMLLNRGTAAVAGLNPHTQRSGLPGASVAGAECGKAADLSPGNYDLGSAIDGWMATLYHRRPMLEPELERIGVGYARGPDGMVISAMMFADITKPTSVGAWPVAYPAKNQRDVPLAFGGEIPNPIPNEGTGGYPITLQFPPFDKITRVSAKLTDAKGKPIPFFVSDPEHPATSLGQYGVICLIPKLSLQPQSAYTAQIEATWNGKTDTWTWSFSTITLRQVEASDERAVAGAINVASLVHGAVANGGMLDGGTAFLQLATGKTDRYKMLSVIIPIAVWREFAGQATPDSFRGKIIQVQATPQLIENKYIDLSISTATQLRVVAS
jgi:Cysteine-rich secretory protein family